MSNRFKDYHKKLNENKTVVISDEELLAYSKTTGNEGVSHVRLDWETPQPPISTTPAIDNEAEDVKDDSGEKEKAKTIRRNLEREQKLKNSIETTSDNL